MMLNTLLLASSLLAPAGDVSIEWKAPKSLLEGGECMVHVDISAPSDGASLPAWVLTPSAFAVDGQPVVERTQSGTIALPGGSKLSLEFDLGRYLKATESFELTFAPEVLQGDPIQVDVLKPAAEGLDFMEMPQEELSQYEVVLDTNQGPIRLELWPDVAPNHVRNFLDLGYTGFYDGVVFHRVIPGFMIQGGDPTGTGTGSGPRKLKAEFNDRSHERGVLSMARSSDPDSASCQFFICHAKAPHLDNQYTAFGKVVTGLDAVDAIANCEKAPGRNNSKPLDPQVIQRALVIARDAQ